MSKYLESEIQRQQILLDQKKAELAQIESGEVRIQELTDLSKWATSTEPLMTTPGIKARIKAFEVQTQKELASIRPGGATKEEAKLVIKAIEASIKGLKSGLKKAEKTTEKADEKPVVTGSKG